MKRIDEKVQETQIHRQSAPVLLVVGHFSLDDIHASETWHTGIVGGSVVYAALAALRGGVRPYLIASLGEDYPVDFLHALEAAGVATGGVQSVSMPQRRARFRYEAEERRINEDENAWLKASERTAPPPPQVSVPARGCLLCPAPPDLQCAWARFAREAGMTVFLDTSDTYVAHRRDDLLAAIKFVDIFLPSQEQVHLLTPGASMPDAMIELSRLGPEIVVVKRGSRGATGLRSHARMIVELPAFATPAADPTGAGDAFCGGFASGWLRTADLPVAMKWGMAAGHLCVQRIGPYALLESSWSLETLVDRLEVDKEWVN